MQLTIYSCYTGSKGVGSRVQKYVLSKYMQGLGGYIHLSTLPIDACPLAYLFNVNGGDFPLPERNPVLGGRQLVACGKNISLWT